MQDISFDLACPHSKKQLKLWWNNHPVEQASSLWQSESNHNFGHGQDASSTDVSSTN
ncbi:MAG: hypothetical protein F6K47_28695 [Symploca sp. SIO2E6]|nr:hypothetical protein [Symploca sp. SIO2E6]